MLNKVFEITYLEGTYNKLNLTVGLQLDLPSVLTYFEGTKMNMYLSSGRYEVACNTFNFNVLLKELENY